MPLYLTRPCHIRNFPLTKPLPLHSSFLTTFYTYTIPAQPTNRTASHHSTKFDSHTPFCMSTQIQHSTICPYKKKKKTFQWMYFPTLWTWKENENLVMAGKISIFFYRLRQYFPPSLIQEIHFNYKKKVMMLSEKCYQQLWWYSLTCNFTNLYHTLKVYFF